MSTLTNTSKFVHSFAVFRNVEIMALVLVTIQKIYQTSRMSVLRKFTSTSKFVHVFSVFGKTMGLVLEAFLCFF